MINETKAVLFIHTFSTNKVDRSAAEFLAPIVLGKYFDERARWVSKLSGKREKHESINTLVFSTARDRLQI